MAFSDRASNLLVQIKAANRPLSNPKSGQNSPESLYGFEFGIWVEGVGFSGQGVGADG